MAIIKQFPLIISTEAAFNLNIGFVPSRIDVYNLGVIGSGTGAALSQWFSGMPNGQAIIQTLTAGVPAWSAAGSGGFTPFQSLDASLWTETIRVISAITNAASAEITSTAHGFTAADVGVTTVTISGVVGMPQINTLRGVIQSIVDANHFTVNINTTSFGTYVSGGQANVITGIPPFTTVGYQVFNTPQRNTGFIGMTLGTAVVGPGGSQLAITAFLDASFTSD